MKGHKIHINHASKSEMASLESQFRSLYSNSKKAKFYNSRLNLGDFRSGECVLVAKAYGHIAGFIWLVWYEHIKHKGIAYIEEMYVEKKFRRMGIGKLLVARALKTAKSNGALVVFVCTGAHMKAAQNFYIKIGMKRLNAPWFFMNLKKDSALL